MIRTCLYSLLVFWSAVALWMAWLGWDTVLDIDPQTGTTSGPYEIWQVAGFVLAAGALAVALRTRLPAWLVVATSTAGITSGAGLSFSSDDSGLAGVGLGLVALGAAAGTSLLMLVVRLIGPRNTAVGVTSAHGDR